VITDTNVTLSRWPFRRLDAEETPVLVAQLRQAGVTQAWASSFDALLHRDIGSVNARLADECRRHGSGLLLPFGAVNPKLPDWQEDLRRCAEDFRMAGIRLYPNYHGYALADPVFTELLRLATGYRMAVQIAVSVEDVRTQHPLVRVPLVDLAPLPETVERIPEARVVVLNWWSALRGDKLRPFANATRIYFDIATVEGVEGIARLAERLPPGLILFGTNAPLFSLQSAVLKMQESGLAEATKRLIFETNASGITRRTQP